MERGPFVGVLVVLFVTLVVLFVTINQPLPFRHDPRTPGANAVPRGGEPDEMRLLA
jgi:hypothetical protein